MTVGGGDIPATSQLQTVQRVPGRFPVGGSSPQPSRTDEETLARVFAECDWSVMFILARSGDNYARLRFNTGPGGDIRLPVGVDYRTWFAAANTAAWQAEYQANVIHSRPPMLTDWPDGRPTHGADFESHGRDQSRPSHGEEVISFRNRNTQSQPVNRG